MQGTNNAPPQQLFDDLPRIVVCTLQQGSPITAMDFHPAFHSLLAGRFKNKLFNLLYHYKEIIKLQLILEIKITSYYQIKLESILKTKKIIGI